jgi:DNA-directed RNA polymerase beta subunit
VQEEAKRQPPEEQEQPQRQQQEQEQEKQQQQQQQSGREASLKMPQQDHGVIQYVMLCSERIINCRCQLNLFLFS